MVVFVKLELELELELKLELKFKPELNPKYRFVRVCQYLHT